MRILSFSFFLVFLTSSAFSQISDSSLRQVQLRGAINFRDLGGYTTSDGRHVKWKTVYRSADISKLTPADLDALRVRHIWYDVDLRGVAESAQAPDRKNPGTDYILCPAGSDSTNTMMARLAGMRSSGDSLMLAFYSNTTYLTARYQPFFAKLLVLPDTDALVFHCTAGKDRTGIGAALLLYALGVPYATIEEDYTATNYYRAGDNEKSMDMMVTRYHFSKEVAEAMMGARPDYLKATFEAIRSRYGSIDHYLAAELGLTPDKRDALKNKFLIN
jgi:protein-tyrosine phosphatase